MKIYEIFEIGTKKPLGYVTDENTAIRAVESWSRNPTVNGANFRVLSNTGILRALRGALATPEKIAESMPAPRQFCTFTLADICAHCRVDMDIAGLIMDELENSFDASMGVTWDVIDLARDSVMAGGA